MILKKRFSASGGVRHNRSAFGFITIILVALLLVSAVVIRKTFQDNLQPLSSDTKAHAVTIKPGATTSEIADTLKSKKLIKSDWAFEWYVRNHDLRDQLKAGTYLISPSQSVSQIVDTIIEGKVATNLVTILPAQRLDQIKDAFVKAGFSKASVERDFNPALYPDSPALRDKPQNASLEGYLYPESFQKTADTQPSDIIKQSLDEMNLRLTPQWREAVSKEGLTVHQAITLASIVEREVSNDSDRAQVAQVFLKRYKTSIALGSDVTAFYGAIIAGKNPSVSYDSPYNTRIHKGLPPGPISNVSESSLNAVAFPAQTDWLYFVAGDDGKTYFSKTLEEHEALTKKYCKKLCS